MEIILGLLSIIILYLLWKHESSQNEINKIRRENIDHVIEEGLTRLSIKKMRRKNELDNMSIDELIESRKEDRDSKSSK